MTAESIFFSVVVCYLRRNRICTVVSIGELLVGRTLYCVDKRIFSLVRLRVPRTFEDLLSDEIFDKTSCDIPIRAYILYGSDIDEIISIPVFHVFWNVNVIPPDHPREVNSRKLVKIRCYLRNCIDGDVCS